MGVSRILSYKDALGLNCDENGTRFRHDGAITKSAARSESWGRDHDVARVDASSRVVIVPDLFQAYDCCTALYFLTRPTRLDFGDDLQHRAVPPK